ncbi:jg5540 [Pararge aegeria aegeria]|uniref:Jg5540 protein n=1 Tax=Pararge aegeria aegeria TaxID=348720 RepID=A0A8S4RS90_9NEOP|nr:jg5540 [Pararge aegeria aegeria]
MLNQKHTDDNDDMSFEQFVAVSTLPNQMALQKSCIALAKCSRKMPTYKTSKNEVRPSVPEHDHRPEDDLPIVTVERIAIAPVQVISIRH